MKRFVLFLFVFAFASDSCAESLRIATYNLNWGNRRGDMVLAAISETQPDLICFQETTVQSERFLRQQLAKTHPHCHSAGHNARFAAERFAFASKTKITDLNFVPPTAGLFGFYSAKLQFNGAAVQIVNVHLTPVTIEQGGGFADAMTALSSAEEKHKIEIDSILDHIDHESPAIVLGDFNSISTFVAPKQLADRGFVDAYASVNDDADTNPTWTWPTRPLPLALRIDYIFHTKHFTTTESKIVRKEGSDHSLVCAELISH